VGRKMQMEGIRGGDVRRSEEYLGPLSGFW
jgi:hypothetical protein